MAVVLAVVMAVVTMALAMAMVMAMALAMALAMTMAMTLVATATALAVATAREIRRTGSIPVYSAERDVRFKAAFKRLVGEFVTALLSDELSYYGLCRRVMEYKAMQQQEQQS